MSINHLTVFSVIQQLATSDGTTAEAMDRVISCCADMEPHPDWKAFRRIDYDADVSSHRSWLTSAVRDDPPKHDVCGLWFGLFNPTAQGQVSADLRFAGTTVYDPGDDDLKWTTQARYWPIQSQAHFASLSQIYNLSYSSREGLGNTAEWSLTLAFAAKAARSVLTPELLQLLPNRPRVIGIAVGFDDGDMLKLGELTVDGFVPVNVSAL